MFEKNGTANTQKKNTQWQKFWQWLTAIDAALNANPHAEAAVTIRQLRQQTEDLETRVNDLEKHDRHAPLMKS